VPCEIKGYSSLWRLMRGQNPPFFSCNVGVRPSLNFDLLEAWISIALDMHRIMKIIAKLVHNMHFVVPGIVLGSKNNVKAYHNNNIFDYKTLCSSLEYEISINNYQK
jgi:hypothetical protein